MKDVCASTETSVEMETSLSQTSSTHLDSTHDTTSRTATESNAAKSRKPHQSSSAGVASSSDWHLQFNIPDASTFSTCVQDAISTEVCNN